MSVFPRNTLFLFDFFEILWYNIYTKMRGEKKMIDAKFVHKAIDGVVGRFKKSQLHIARHFCEVVYEDDEPCEIHFYIESEIKLLLDGLNIKNDVRLIDMYRAVRFDVYVLTIAFIVNEELHTVDYVVEGDNY